jgi:hypothetical protein
MDLDVRIHEAACRADDGAWFSVFGQEAVPEGAVPADPGDATLFEEFLVDGSALRMWAFLYGMAYAVERIDNPLDSEERWQERAREAADNATRWHFDVRGRGGES